MLLIIMFCLIGVFLGFLILSILINSGRDEDLKEIMPHSISDEHADIKILCDNFSNISCLRTWAKRKIKMNIFHIVEQKERILFVDDEEELCDVVERMLRHLGYEVLALQSSVEAMDYIKSKTEKFDLIILDQVMPVLSGTDLSQEAIQLRPDTPIILFTGFGEIVPQEIAKTMGIREIVKKPIIISDLSKIIARVLHPMQDTPKPANNYRY
jgi:CheY-like chemotaxis protein